jgi:hypothetical protein
MNWLHNLAEFLLANRVLLLVGAIALGAWLYLRTPATPLASASSLHDLLGQGDPVVLEFYGNT